MSDRELIALLREEFSISREELDLAIRHAQRLKGSVHMVLWQLGLITLDQLDALIGRMISADRSTQSPPTAHA